jgi:DNA (cytosine-5)-methyltransferase 1
MDSLPARDNIREINNSRDGRKNRVALSNLREAVVDSYYQKMWPTPRSTDGDKGTRTAEGAAKELQRGKNVDLGVFVKMWPTPTSLSPAKNGYNGAGNSCGLVAIRQQIQDEDSTATGSLNPTWVEWLMGFPSGWTDCEDSETP